MTSITTFKHKTDPEITLIVKIEGKDLKDWTDRMFRWQELFESLCFKEEK